MLQLSPDIVNPAVNNDGQQQLQVQPQCEVAIRPLGAEVVHDGRLVQLCLQLVTQITRHCRGTQSMNEALGLAGYPQAFSPQLSQAAEQVTAGPCGAPGHKSLSVSTISLIMGNRLLSASGLPLSSKRQIQAVVN